MMRWAVGVAALIGLAVAVWQLESGRAGVTITRDVVGTTPVTVYVRPDAAGPAVVIAHGFAGSRQLMESYALTLAQGGYRVVSFDFEGHGRNPVPMGGDVTAIDGTTLRLVTETAAVVAHAARLPGAGSAPVALLGHSMASDVIVRTAQAVDRPGPVIAISMYSEAVTPFSPRSLLMITGGAEPRLREAALSYLRMVSPDAGEGQTARAGPVARRAVVAPGVEHVGVLYSGTGLREALAWLDEAYGHDSGDAGPVRTGPWILVMLASVVILAWPLAARLPVKSTAPPVRLAPARFWTVLAVPALSVPLVLSLFETRVLPVLVADYLALHLLAYGVIALALGWRFGLRMGPVAPVSGVVLLVYGLGVFGVLLDRYVASFVPIGPRWPIIAAIALGAVPFMVSDALLSEAGAAPLWRRLAVRGVFLASLALAVALDFERLFFLILILPVILLYFLVFGTMGGWVGRRSHAPLPQGVALGLILAWAIGCSFPLFAA